MKKTLSLLAFALASVASFGQEQPDFSKATPLNPVDITSLIVNPNFNSNEGWNGNDFVVGGSQDEPCAEVFNTSFDVNQTISDLPVGIYNVKAQGFYRHGSINNAENTRYNEGRENIFDAYFYGNEISINIPSIFRDYTLLDPAWGGRFTSDLPDDLYAASMAFEHGLYGEDLFVYVYNTDKLTIGARKTSGSTPEFNWTAFDNFQVEYLGNSAEAWSLFREMYSIKNYKCESITVSQPLLNEYDKAISDFKAATEPAKLVEYSMTIERLKIEIDENIRLIEKVADLSDQLIYTYELFEETASQEVLAHGQELLNKSNSKKITSLTGAEVKQLVVDLKECIAELKLYDPTKASDEEPVNLTRVLDNGRIENDPASVGWNFYKNDGNGPNFSNGGWDGSNACEFWSPSAATLKFDYWQTQKLSEGTYTLSVDAANSYNGQEPLGNKGRAFIYAGIIANGDTIFVNDMPVFTQNEACTDSHSRYYVTFKVPAPNAYVIMGIKSAGDMDARWFVCDNFKLEYYGNESSKEASEGAIINTIYLINAIGTVEITTECKERIDAAREAYDALSSSEQEIITEELLQVLLDAESEFKTTNVAGVNVRNTSKTYKYIKDNKVIIVKDGQKYNVLGQKM